MSAEVLSTELAMLKTALDASSIVVFTDRKGDITHVNDHFCAISGYSQQELIGQNHRIINSGYHSRDFFKEMWRIISAGRIWRGEIQNVSKSGQRYWVDGTIIPFSKEGPYSSSYVAILNDITQKKSAQRELEEERSRRLYLDKMATLGELTAGIAHELGNPIAAIQGRAEMLKVTLPEEMSPFSEQVGRTADIILSLTKRMEVILRNMCSFARNGEGDPILDTPLKNVFENTLDLCAQRHSRSRISISIDPYDERISLPCRETQIIQVLVNLVNNACDAIQDLEDRWIQLRVFELDSAIQISITDSGPGIAPEAKPALFHPFFTTKAAGKGTGLGLYISRQIAEQHGGTLILDETSPRTRFILTLPTDPAQAQIHPGLTRSDPDSVKSANNRSPLLPT